MHISLLIQTRQLLSLEKALLCIEESYCNQKFPWKGMFGYDCNLGSLKSPAISPVVPVGDLFRLLSQWQLCLGRLYSFLVRDVTSSDVPITPWIDFTCASRLITQSVPHSVSDATFVPSLGNRGYSRNERFYLHKTLTDEWSHVEYLWIIVMFLSSVQTLILAAPIHSMIHWWASSVMLN